MVLTPDVEPQRAHRAASSSGVGLPQIPRQRPSSRRTPVPVHDLRVYSPVTPGVGGLLIVKPLNSNPAAATSQSRPRCPIIAVDISFEPMTLRGAPQFILNARQSSEVDAAARCGLSLARTANSRRRHCAPRPIQNLKCPSRSNLQRTS